MDSFEYVQGLGEGAYGHVWLCRMRNTGQHVAMKRFKEAHTDAEVGSVGVWGGAGGGVGVQGAVGGCLGRRFGAGRGGPCAGRSSRRRKSTLGGRPVCPAGAVDGRPMWPRPGGRPCGKGQVSMHACTLAWAHTNARNPGGIAPCTNPCTTAGNTTQTACTSKLQPIMAGPTRAPPLLLPRRS